MLSLKQIKRTDPLLLKNMQEHYSKPKGFVGRNICYEISYSGVVYGHIVGGSATLHLVGRDEFFGFSESDKLKKLNSIVNNIFFHVKKVDGKYPLRWFTVKALALFRDTISVDWKNKYGDTVIGFESLVELPRTGDLYKKDRWELVGTTKGYTCKREGGKGTDNWTGKRVWDTKNLKPKLVFCKKV